MKRTKPKRTPKKHTVAFRVTDAQWKILDRMSIERGRIGLHDAAREIVIADIMRYANGYYKVGGSI
jgi:hypothetical protein